MTEGVGAACLLLGMMLAIERPEWTRAYTDRNTTAFHEWSGDTEAARDAFLDRIVEAFPQ